MTVRNASIARSSTGVLATAARNLAIQDGVCLLFHATMLLRLLCAPASADKLAAEPGLLLLLLGTALAIVLTRGEVLPPGRLRGIVYRVGLIGPMPLSYFTLRHFLAALQPGLLDAGFLRVDQELFGQTPAMFLSRFVTSATTEWFAFFYYGYFGLTALFVLGTAFFDRGRRQAELLLGAMFVVCLGHTLYGFFPGLGPYATLRFKTALHGGLFWHLVQGAVSSAGALYDIFPSLHTAYPSLFALHALRYRRQSPYRQVWPLVVFFSANVVVATMFLRWHYGIDVVAGLTLAVLSQRIGIVVARIEEGRVAHGKQPLWDPL